MKKWTCETCPKFLKVNDFTGYCDATFDDVVLKNHVCGEHPDFKKWMEERDENI